ncbi:MAG: hypothetical protein HYY45_07820 [Deltaproteobacteria bacterium]|nr:hypothetical protein [Deltaproteobacteria bacterium]
METAKYEFSEAENQSIGTLASRMKWVGLFLIIIGGATALASIVGLVQSAAVSTLNVNALIFLLFAVIFLLTGIWTLDAAKSFSLIVKTAGSDIANLMDALTDLLKLYYMQFWLMIDSLIAVIAAALILWSMSLL